MRSDIPPTPEDLTTLYVVVCTSFHTAIGPYADPSAALDAARELNSRKDGCKYLPVPLPVPGASVQVQGAAPTDPTEYRPGGYL